MKGRIRTIKPEIALDEELWKLIKEMPEAPVFQVYTMLWCHADREGRFEWRPVALKVVCCPYWDGDFDLVLRGLERHGKVLRYEVDGKQYGWLQTFADEQAPNNREPASSLPAPGDSIGRSRDDDSGGFVYVATYNGAPSFKVGFSKRDPYKRVGDLSTGSPLPLRLIEAIAGSIELETQVHRALSGHRMHREWFAANDASIAILQTWFKRDPRATQWSEEN